MSTTRTESVGPTVTGIGVAFGALSTVVITVRMFSRIYITRSVACDDVLMIGAFIFSWAFIAVTIMAVRHGLGSHIEAVLERGAANFNTYLQIVWLSSIFYNSCLGFVKTSVLILYSRLGDRHLRRNALIMTAIVASQASANVLTCIFQCNPVPAAWDLSITKKTCVNINAFYLANAALNITTDLLTYILPIRMVARLQLPKRQKVGVGVMLSLGLLACVSSIIRISFIPRMLKDPDATWAISGAMYWSVIETNVGILAASIPSFKPVAKRYLPRLVGETLSHNRYYNSKNGSGTHKQSRSRNHGGSRAPYDNFSHGSQHVHQDAGGLNLNRLPYKGAGTVTTVTAQDGYSDTGSGREMDREISRNGGGAGHEHVRASQGSEERLVPLQGQIMKQTRITKYEETTEDRDGDRAGRGNHAY